MKMTSVWRGNKPNRKQKRAVPKLRIPWSELGLIDPSVVSQERSMEQIRREVTALASTGFGEETRARSEQPPVRASHSRPRTNKVRPTRRPPQS
ncbi:MAG: hypothetical protein R3B11_08235 [Nitrospira sp.]|jgi:hypothetical protein|nr:hypothetical protein [Nitrospira sp.]HAP38187.1 hypothetical protein [Nitrospira sp.]